MAPGKTLPEVRPPSGRAEPGGGGPSHRVYLDRAHSEAGPPLAFSGERTGPLAFL